MRKLAPKCHGPFVITKQVSPVAYQLGLPPTWTIHDVFHASLLTRYKETVEHRVNFHQPPPEMIDGEEEYEVQAIIGHQFFGQRRKLQYLIRWKGYYAADDTWEAVKQIFAPQLIEAYHRKHPKNQPFPHKKGPVVRGRLICSPSNSCLTTPAMPQTSHLHYPPSNSLSQYHRLKSPLTWTTNSSTVSLRPHQALSPLWSMPPSPAGGSPPVSPRHFTGLRYRRECRKPQGGHPDHLLVPPPAHLSL